ncbi:MAG: signal recognition particle protein [Sneathiella sp.]|uniref:signal recognition particle protein n=1 Tax=Sneathiella sp. TaxID=1964365 RepID=UPI003001FF94
MFENLTGRLGDVLGKLTKRGALSEADVSEAMREVRIALLEADVALPVVKSFIKRVKTRAIGTEVLKSVNPAQMVIKVVHEQLIEMLGSEQQELNLVAVPPIVYMMVGLQGSGKTTSTAKIAKWLTEKHNKKVMMASLDVQRPAAQEQLRVLGEQTQIATLPIVAGQMPVEIANRALQSAKLQGIDVILLDTAGRLHVDEQLMAEMEAVHKNSVPTETLLVVDSLTGQDAVNVAEQFKARVDVTGIVMTRIDGDGRGGAALSMREVTGCPIKLLGTGEQLDALEAFHPDRIANRILGMGDIVSLVEKAAETIEQDEAEKLALKMQKGIFDLDDLASQLRQMRKMGGMSGLVGMLPGMGKMKKQLDGANLDDKLLIRQEAMIQSMTPKERRNPQIIAASRKKRIASGSGMSVQDVNRLLKQHKQMSGMMKKVKKLGKKGIARGGMQGLLPPGMKF